jgi:hypothetical protein
MVTAGWVAIALAVVCLVSLGSIILLFTVGGPFGFLNDAGNALIGLLSAALALMLVSQVAGWAGVVATVAGAAVAVWGSWLVMTGSTGFVLAGFVSTIGFGLIGLWLALAAWGRGGEGLFGPLLGVARSASVAMMIGGLAAVPGSLMRSDSYDAMPGWLWLFALGWIGVYALYPITMLALGRRLVEP